MTAKRSLFILLTIIMSLTLIPGLSPGVSLTLGSGIADPGETVSLPLLLAKPGANRISSLQWTVIVPAAQLFSLRIEAGPEAVRQGKTLHCVARPAGRYNCLLAGLNSNDLSGGVIANVLLSISQPAASSFPVVLTDVVAASPDATNVPVAAAGGTLNLRSVTTAEHS
jgi:hypothetical protein